MLAAGCVLAAPVSAAPPATAASKWTLEAGYTSENGAPLRLSAVWCTSTGWCAAVGNEDQGRGPTGVYAETGNGSVWTVAPSSGPSLSALRGVSCVAPNWCQAVGDAAYRKSDSPLNEQWNGRAWSRAPGPAGSGYLSGVSCVSRSFCMAVGAGQAGVPLVERWNGKQWSVVASPKKGSVYRELDAVACVSPTWCAAVGFSGSPERRPGHPETWTLIELWNGRTWRIVPSPNTSGTEIVTLNAVDCVSSTWCMAGGFGETGALIEHWNGRGWSIMGHPSDKRPGQGAAVWGVSCVSRTACVVVGYDMPLAESWNGKVWSPMSNVDDSPAVIPPGLFSGVACITAVLCKAVGEGNAYYTHS